jgi:hypothetical protein
MARTAVPRDLNIGITTITPAMERRWSLQAGVLCLVGCAKNISKDIWTNRRLPYRIRYPLKFYAILVFSYLVSYPSEILLAMMRERLAGQRHTVTPNPIAQQAAVKQGGRATRSALVSPAGGLVRRKGRIP